MMAGDAMLDERMVGWTERQVNVCTKAGESVVRLMDVKVEDVNAD